MQAVQVLKKATGAAGAAMAVGMLLGASAAHAQTVFNEDFSSGLASGTATSTDYALISTGVFTLPGQYRVVNNPSPAFTNGYTSYFDHTVGTSAGAMLFFDGSASGSAQRIFYRTATLTAGTQCTFSFWGSSCGPTSAPTLNVLVDGFGLGVQDLTTTNGVWSQFTANYLATSGGTHTFAIYDTNTQGSGNDGAIDDVRLAGPAAPEPGTLCLLGIGLVTGAGILALRRGMAGTMRLRKPQKQAV